MTFQNVTGTGAKNNTYTDPNDNKVYEAIAFDKPGTYTFKTNVAMDVDFAAIAGGGGGGFCVAKVNPGSSYPTADGTGRGASGGGQGQAIVKEKYRLPAGTHTVVIGHGGKGATLMHADATNGEDTVLTLGGTVFTLKGGGLGESPSYKGFAGQHAGSGSCGGGGSEFPAGTAINPAVGTNGGHSTNQYGGKGGGSAQLLSAEAAKPPISDANRYHYTYSGTKDTTGKWYSSTRIAVWFWSGVCKSVYTDPHVIQFGGGGNSNTGHCAATMNSPSLTNSVAGSGGDGGMGDNTGHALTTNGVKPAGGQPGGDGMFVLRAIKIAETMLSAVNVNGNWKQLDDTTPAYVNVRGVWKPVSEGYVNVAGVWKKMWP